jgi:antitoxin HicB
MTRKARRGSTAKARATATRPVAEPAASEGAITDVLSRPYSWVVARDANGRFSARISELPGCATDGATRAEALHNLEDAAHDWVKGALEDGFPIPQPQEREGASGKVLLRLPRKLHRQVQDLAAADGVSANTFIVAAISAHVGAMNLAKDVLMQLRQVVVTATVGTSGHAVTSSSSVAATAIKYDNMTSALTPQRPGYVH